MSEPADKPQDIGDVSSLKTIRCHAVFGEFEDHPGSAVGQRCGCTGGFLGNSDGKCGRTYSVPDAGPGATMTCMHTEEYHYSDF